MLLLCLLLFLTRPLLLPSGEDNNYRKSTAGSNRGRVRNNNKHSNNILAPIKENVSQDMFQRNFRHGSFRELRKTKVGDDQESEEKNVKQTLPASVVCQIAIN